MNWSSMIFPLLMIVFPAAFMTLVPRNQRAATDLPRARRLLLRLWLATLGAVGVWLLLYVMISPRIASFAWVFFFPLFFGFYWPLMRAKNPDWVSMPPPDLPVRGASLSPRLARPTVPAWSVAAIWIMWGGFFAAVLLIVDWTVLRTSDEALMWRGGMGRTAIWLSGLMVFLPPLTMICLRLDRREPQTLDPAGSAELVDLYARRRRQRAWLFIGLALAMLTLQGTITVCMALISRGIWSEHEAGYILGFGGGTAGTIVGVAGAIIGTMSSIQAVRINRRLRELASA